MTCRPEKHKGCVVGGSLVFASHNCVNVRRHGIMKYGVIDRISMSWRRQRVIVVSTYRPYTNKAKGSLRSAIKEGDEDVEVRYWEAMRTAVDGDLVIVGGDFNMLGDELDDRIDGMGLVRALYDGNEYSFKSDVGLEHGGRVIDHVLSKGVDCGAHISQSGRFLKDHMPIVAEIHIQGVLEKVGKRVKQVNIPTIRPGDEGAKRRLLKEFEKVIAKGLDGWTHKQIVVWTANKAKEIAKSRNRKDNPNGWSPLTRLMRLKVRVLGMLLRRMELNRGVGDCYKMYKETKRNMREVVLSEEESLWLDLNGVDGSLPD